MLSYRPGGPQVFIFILKNIGGQRGFFGILSRNLALGWGRRVNIDASYIY